MSEDQKTNINNLTIVWQGSNWSVITPDGEVIARFMDKRHAEDFAKVNYDYIFSANFTEDDGEIITGSQSRQIFLTRGLEQNYEKRKNNERMAQRFSDILETAGRFIISNKKLFSLLIMGGVSLILIGMAIPFAINLGSELLIRGYEGVSLLGNQLNVLYRQALALFYNLGLLLVMLGVAAFLLTGLFTLLTAGALGETMGCSLELIKWGGIFLIVVGGIGTFALTLPHFILALIGLGGCVWIFRRIFAD